MARAYHVAQSWSVMCSPEGRSHSISRRSDSPPWPALPVKKRLRRRTGWSWRSFTILEVKSSSLRSCSSRSQSIQVISLSWQ